MSVEEIARTVSFERSGRAKERKFDGFFLQEGNSTCVYFANRCAFKQKYNTKFHVTHIFDGFCVSLCVVNMADMTSLYQKS